LGKHQETVFQKKEMVKKVRKCQKIKVLGMGMGVGMGLVHGQVRGYLITGMVVIQVTEHRTSNRKKKKRMKSISLKEKVRKTKKSKLTDQSTKNSRNGKRAEVIEENLDVIVG
jgi:hypothetical protein